MERRKRVVHVAMNATTADAYATAQKGKWLVVNAPAINHLIRQSGVFALVCAVVAALLFFDAITMEQWGPFALAMVGPFGVLLAIRGLRIKRSYARMRRNCRHIRRSVPVATEGSYTYEFDDIGITHHVNDQRIEYRWEYFTDYMIYREILYCFRGRELVILIASGEIGGAHFAELCGIVAERLPLRDRRPRILLLGRPGAMTNPDRPVPEPEPVQAVEDSEQTTTDRTRIVLVRSAKDLSWRLPLWVDYWWVQTARIAQRIHFLLLLAAISVVVAVVTWRIKDIAGESIVGVVTVIAVPIALFVLFYVARYALRFRRFIRKMSQALSDRVQPQELPIIEFDERGFLIDYGTTRFERSWRRFTSYLRYNDVLYIYTAAGVDTYFAREELGEAAFDELAAILGRQLPARAYRPHLFARHYGRYRSAHNQG